MALPRAAAPSSWSARLSGPARWSRWIAARRACVASDQQVEQKIAKAVGDRWATGTGVHLNVTSYDGKVLLTGEVPDCRDPRRDREDRELHDRTSAA